MVKHPGGWIPEEKITLPEAIEAYTMGAAFAEFQEREKGSITPGKLADMVILSDNIFDVKPEALRNVKVKTTIDGRQEQYTVAVARLSDEIKESCSTVQDPSRAAQLLGRPK